MALANYTDLLASMAGWLNREDMTARLPDFVSLAEADFNRQLRVHQMVVRASSPLASGSTYFTTPADWLESIALSATTSRGPIKLEYVTPADMDDYRLNYSDGAVLVENTAPAYYSVVGSRVEVAPTPTSDATLIHRYYGAIPALAASGTNWLLTSAPDAYLYGALLHAAPYLDDDARVMVWQAGYQRAITGLQTADERAKYSGGPLKRRFNSF